MLFTKMIPEETSLTWGPLESLMNGFLAGSTYWPEKTGGLSVTDWLLFSLGLTIGTLVTIATSPFAGFFDPCLVQWATLTATSFYFYLYMSAYIDSNFESTESMLLMILNFVQFGQATQLGYCSDDHGFRSSGLHTSYGILEFASNVDV